MAESAIRALRDRSNAAIAARDAARVVSFMDADVVVEVAGGPTLRGIDANRRAFAEQMRDPAFGGYTRTPDVITVGEEGTSAVEEGRWVGRWRVRSATHEQRGRYIAQWRCSALGWVIVSERYLEG